MQITKNPKNLLAILLLILCTILFSFFIHSEKSSISSPKELTSMNENSTTVATSTITSTEKDLTLMDANSEISTEENQTTTDTNDTNLTDETSSFDASENISNILNNESINTEKTEFQISPSEQTLLDAGIGKVVLLPTGDYGILMQSPDHMINGKLGNEILREHLASQGLEGSIYGCWLNDQYYNYFAENLRELITPDNVEFWD